MSYTKTANNCHHGIRNFVSSSDRFKLKFNDMKALRSITLAAFLVVSCFSFAGSNGARASLSVQFNMPQPDDWVELGTRMVNMQAEHDEIEVTAKEGAFTKVRLHIMKAPIHLLNINIIFGNGENENVVFNKKFAPDTYTRIIDLPGNKRIIKKVKLNYESVPVGKGRAVIVLYGKH